MKKGFFWLFYLLFLTFFDIDSNIVRIVWLILVLCAGTGLLAYIICAIVLDDNPNE